MLVALSTTFLGIATAILLGGQVLADRRAVSRTIRQVRVHGTEPWDVRPQDLADPLLQRVVQPAWHRVRGYVESTPTA